MDHVEIIYNPYQPSTQIFMNGEPFHPSNPRSLIFKFLDQPFEQWCDKILDDIASNINDIFDFTFTSCRTENEIMRKIAPECQKCAQIDIRESPIDFSPLERFTKCFDAIKIISDNLKYAKEKFLLNLIVDNTINIDIIENSLKESHMFIYDANEKRFLTPLYAPYNIGINIVSDEKKIIPVANSINILVTDNAKAKIKMLQTVKPSFLFEIASSSPQFMSMQGGTFIYQMSYKDIVQKCLELLEFKFMRLIFGDIISAGSTCESLSNTSLEAVKMLDKIEHFTSVSCSKTKLFVGESTPLEVVSYPKVAEAPDIIFESTHAGVVSCGSQSITAIGSGETEVSIFLAENKELVGKFSITVSKKIVVNEIKLEDRRIILAPDATEVLLYTVMPEYLSADQLTWTSTDPEIATVDEKGVVTAIKDGTCTIRLSFEDVAAECEVLVKKIATSLELTDNQLTLNVGETRPLAVQPFSEDTLEEDIFFKIDNKSIISFEDGVLKALAVGEATITFHTQNFVAEGKCKVNVKGFDPNKEGASIFLLVSATIVMLASFLTSEVPGVKFIVPLISIIFSITSMTLSRKYVVYAVSLIFIGAAAILLGFI